MVKGVCVCVCVNLESFFFHFLLLFFLLLFSSFFCFFVLFYLLFFFLFFFLSFVLSFRFYFFCPFFVSVSLITFISFYLACTHLIQSKKFHRRVLRRHCFYDEHSNYGCRSYILYYCHTCNARLTCSFSTSRPRTMPVNTRLTKKLIPSHSDPAL